MKTDIIRKTKCKKRLKFNATDSTNDEICIICVDAQNKSGNGKMWSIPNARDHA